MKRVVYSLLVVLATSLLALAQGQDKFPTGTYTAGPFTLSLGTDGVHTVSTEGRVVVKGTFKVENDQITFTDQEGEFACTGQAGKYKWSFEGKNLSFTKVQDDCEGRSQGLSSQPWIKK